MTPSDDRGLVRLALWASLMMPIKEAGMSWPGFAYTDAEWKQMATLAGAVEPGTAFRFQMVNAVVFIALAGVLVVGGFLPLLGALYPVPADVKALPFALLLAATALLALGIGLPLSMGVAAWLVAGGLRPRLVATPQTAALWSKVSWQIRRMAVLMCGALVPGMLLWITFDIDGGPIITTLKWIGFAAVAASTAHTLRRRDAPQP
ncbi:MAG TPA: hypothetical protein VKX28_11720 [Xanthobacteraceae bacterium]|nr:hypothetical protein [Xanthobacteraceae bacterium]